MIPFNNLKLLDQGLTDQISLAVQQVLESGFYLLGKELESFEALFADYLGAKFTVGVANGTDAIELALRAAGIGAGDEVITVSHTAVPTVCAIESAGARPVLVDIDPTTYTIDPVAVEAVITSKTKAIVAVHLYGQSADMTKLTTISQRHNLVLIEDCAQAHGARHTDRMVGTFGHLAAFSFYPTKNLGAYGDGGAVVTNDRQLADRVRRLRNYGQGQRYYHSERGINSRLDEIQAAILRVKLPHLDEHNRIRRQIANLYWNNLKSIETITLPQQQDSNYHVYHLYVIRYPERDRLRELLQARGIQTLIHYPVPVHRQVAYTDLGYADGSLPTTESLANEILSLPLYIGLEDSDIETVCSAIRQSVKELEA